jgi:hypothetical protein
MIMSPDNEDLYKVFVEKGEGGSSTFRFWSCLKSNNCTYFVRPLPCALLAARIQ